MEAQRTPGPLTATKTTPDHEDAQYKIESDYFFVEGEWRDKYVSFCGYFGSYGPHVFAAAPELLAIAKKLDQASRQSADALDFSKMVDEFIEDCRSAIAQATGGAP